MFPEILHLSMLQENEAKNKRKSATFSEKNDEE